MTNQNLIKPELMDSVAKATTGVKDTLLLVTLLLLGQTASFASAPGMPPDGYEQPFWTVDAEIDSVTPPKSLTDLSDAPFLSLDIVKYRVYGDSLMCAAREGSREWYSARGDSLWHVGWNDRHVQARLDRGFLFLPPYGSKTAQILYTDSITVTSSPARTARTQLMTAFSSEMAGGFVMPDGDTIPCTWMVEERTAAAAADLRRSSRNRRWYTPTCAFPVVECVDYTDADGEPLQLVIICPPSEQAQTAHIAKAKVRAGETTGMPEGDNGPGLIDGVRIVYDRKSRTLRLGQTGHTEGSDIAIRVFDTLGRLVAEGTGAELPLPGLPRGSYAVEFEAGGKSSSAKIWIE